jgi:hypothetical protein
MLGYSDLDYAVVRFHGGGANCAQEQYDVGYLGWAMFRDTVGTFSLTTMGYPGINYVNPEWARLHYSVLTYQSEPGIARTNSNAPGFVFHKLDTGRGQSGSPLFQWGCYDAVLVRAVHRGSAGTQANKGIRLSPGVVRSMLFLRAAAKELWGKLS